MSLPEGYSLRLAIKKDIAMIIYFEIAEYLISNLFTAISLLAAIIYITCISIETHTLVLLSVLFVSFLAVCLYSIARIFLTMITNQVFYNLSYFSWVVEYESKIHGYVVCIKHKEYTIIDRVLIGINHRNKGIGTALIERCINNATIPFYLICPVYLKHFYNRLGFVEADYLNTPSHLASWRNDKNFDVMVLEN
jgi:N-acetylglutamate synthase-like GNAT family acetyltransferase